MKKIYLTIALAIGIMASAQVKIGDNATSVNANSLLELESTTKGVLFPRVALTGTANVAPLAAHVAGMTVYNTATTGDVTPGMYTNSGSAWVKLGASSAPAVSVVVNTGSTYTILGSEDLILHNGPASTFTLPSTATVGKRIVIANNTASTGNVSIAVALGGSFWNGSGYATAAGNSNVFTYTANGWICEAIGLN
jgi:acyl-[acyl carrier protein]--UDP-N-acetylglucosamine O-acyltransferase